MAAAGVIRRGRVWKGAALFACAALFWAQADLATAEPARWVVQGPAGRAVLYGTDHGVAPSPIWDTPKLKAAFDRADELWSESGDEPAPDGSKPGPMAAAMLQPPGRALADELSPRDRRLLSEVEEKLHIDAAFIARLRPGAAAVLITEIAYQRAGAPVGVGVEAVLTERARARGLPIKSLEPHLDQAVLGEILAPPKDEAADNLREALKDYPELVERRVRNIRLWEAGDLDALSGDCRRGMTPKLHEDLVTSRNRTFTRRILERLKAPGEIFVAMGACHLLGDDSVVSMLRANGLKVERR
jgi:uncharacterized protein YbaP (TraB family)